jgi:hypothetical protein
MATADSIIAEAQDAYQDAKNIADNALNATDNALTAAGQAVDGLNLNWSVVPVSPTAVGVSDTRLAVQIPVSDFSNDVKLAFDEKFAQLNAEMLPQIQEYLDNFFPDIGQAVKDESDGWIVNTIVNGEYVPQSVENAIWNKARDREVAEALRNEASALDAGAVRGFSTPSGLINYAVVENQMELSRKLITIERDLAIKLFDVANENSKFAIQSAISLRTAFVGALGNFINLAMQQPNQAIDYAKTILAAKTGLHDAAMNLYTRRIEEERLRSTVGFGNLDEYVKYTNMFVDGRSKLTDAQIRMANVKSSTAISAAETLSRVGAAALQTRNTMISASAGVT